MMPSNTKKNHLHLAHSLWKELLSPGDLVIDATLGNGYDAMVLFELGAEVIGIDIQKEALEKTRERLRNRPIQLLQRSHADLSSLELDRRPRLIVYNLGYLPGGDKQITTQLESTMASVESALSLIAPNGAISITCYPGHDEGLKEETFLVKWASQLEPKRWGVCHYRWLNRALSPSLLWLSSLEPSDKSFHR